MNSIPDYIKVAGITYKVQEVDGILEKFNILGQINYHKGIIELDTELPLDRKEQTFIHEVLHAVFKEAGYDEQDEEMIDRVSMVLYQVLKDNYLFFNNYKLMDKIGGI
ncbi:ImmA/IrrE family metallo-endopeptidase [Priestia megaterium]|uniref:ImmA/IrrE family metallo-endopeptidase n=1 Tax=Priestia megaterium TaxID=1404 RepID=UPI003CC5557A